MMVHLPPPPSGCVRYEGITVPLPKRVAVVSKYYIRCDIAGSRGGSLGWLVINIEVGAPTFTWYKFSTHHTHDHLQIMLHVDWSNILRYISVIDSDSLVLPTGFGIRRRYTTLKTTIASLHPAGMYSLPKLYWFNVISSPTHGFWPYPSMNTRTW